MRPPAVFPFVPEPFAQVGHDLFGVQLGVLPGLFAAQVAEVQQRKKLADVHFPQHFVEPFADRGRRAGDHVALIDELLPSQALQLLEAERRLERLDGLERQISRGRGPVVGDVQAAVVEVRGRFCVVLLGLGVRLRHADELQIACAVRVAVAPGAIDRFPIAPHDVRSRLVAEVAQESVHVVVLGDPLPGFHAAAAGDPDGRMRLLDRPRPDVDVAQLVELAVEGERLRLGPRLDDQVVSFAVLVAQRDRGLAVGEIRVHRRADRKAAHEAAARNAVQHGHFFGDADGRVVQRNRIAQHDQRRLGRPPRQRCQNDVRRGHQAVGVGMVFVDADSVEALAVGEFQLVEILVVGFVTSHRIEQRTRHVHPHAGMLLFEILGQVRVRHEMEPVTLHRASSFCAPQAALRSPCVSARRIPDNSLSPRFSAKETRVSNR